MEEVQNIIDPLAVMTTMGYKKGFQAAIDMELPIKFLKWYSTSIYVPVVGNSNLHQNVDTGHDHTAQELYDEFFKTLNI